MQDGASMVQDGKMQVVQVLHDGASSGDGASGNYNGNSSARCLLILDFSQLDHGKLTGILTWISANSTFRTVFHFKMLKIIYY